MPRMAIAVQDDRGTYSIPPGTSPTPWNVMQANLLPDIEAYEDAPPDVDVESLVGWGRWTYGVIVNGTCIAFIDGERPTHILGVDL